MSLSAFDLLIVALYLVGITLFGLRFRSKEKSLKTYFLADKSVPWWAIALSIVSAETSTLTIISIPGLAYDSDFGFLQIVFGYLIARIVISFLFLPAYFKGELFTAYQLIERRFGPRLHRFTAGTFLLTRALAEGVRVFAISIVVNAALEGYLLQFMSRESGTIFSIAIVTLLTLVYTFEGGMTAVIWTDVVQMFIYITGTLAGLVVLISLVPGGWHAIAASAAAAGKFQILHMTPSFTDPYFFWAGVIGGTFLTTASHGTDQLMVQRLLAARDQRESRIALLASGGFILFQFTLFLLVGTALWVFYSAQHFERSDRIFPAFIVSEMPVGFAGVLIAAILAAAMSNLSAALNSLSSTTVIDFYSRLRPNAGEVQKISVSRTSTVVWALVLFFLAVLTQFGGQRVLEVGLSIASVPYGGLLGVFLLGVATKRATEMGAIIGMMAGLLVNLGLWFAPRLGWVAPQDAVAWTWYVSIGASLTFAVGYLASTVLPPTSAAAHAEKAKHWNPRKDHYQPPKGI
jgi:SSS family transporter